MTAATQDVEVGAMTEHAETILAVLLDTLGNRDTVVRWGGFSVATP